MKDIYEIIFHARAGQGAKSAAQFIAETALKEGKEMQAFPEYGPERTGAPMRSFVRISEREIRSFEPIVHPDAIIILDSSIVGSVDVLAGATKDTLIILNTGCNPKECIPEKDLVGELHTIDATAISVGILGRNIPNLIMAAAWIKLTKKIKFEDFIGKVRETFEPKIGKEKTEKNIQAMKKAYEEMK
ncbi:2-oxoacid:acceptor oxidoreductase family protein [Candidatus Woesearchaeota archaeon]|nr:2-oxoacid:acceptor oxidoreductase family protein [Candidatus Woesearchaeota archaeon]